MSCTKPHRYKWRQEPSGLVVWCAVCGEALAGANGPREISRAFWDAIDDLVREQAPEALMFWLVVHADGRREWHAKGGGPWPRSLRVVSSAYESGQDPIRYRVDAQCWATIDDLFQGESPGCVWFAVVLFDTWTLPFEWWGSAEGPWHSELEMAAGEYERGFPADCGLDDPHSPASSAFEDN